MFWAVVANQELQLGGETNIPWNKKMKHSVEKLSSNTALIYSAKHDVTHCVWVFFNNMNQQYEN